MLNWIAFTSFLLPNPAPAAAPPSFSWAQPPIGCVEEVIIQNPQIACPDLRNVKNPSTDLPADMTPKQRALWQHRLKRELSVCRAEEILRREENAPGSMRPDSVEISWMLAQGARNTNTKIDAIYEASERFGIPPQVLLGALSQESLMAELGISEDGENYSCGIGQMNVLEWCNAMEAAPIDSRQEWDWPVEQIAEYRKSHPRSAICAAPLLSTALVAPFYELGIQNLDGSPGYRLGPEQMAEITASEIVPQFPNADAETQALRFSIVQQFTQRCSDTRAGILAKAHELKRLYEKEVPPALRQLEVYAPSDHFERACRKPDTTGVFPLQSAWLLADAVYNAGTDAVRAVAYYLRMDPQSYSTPEAWEKMNPQLLIESLYGAGKYDPSTDLLDFSDFAGEAHTRTWFKSCVVQRHIAHLMDHVTLPDVTLAASLEGPDGCQKSTFDEQGHLIRSAVPLARQKSSGQIDP